MHNIGKINIYITCTFITKLYFIFNWISLRLRGLFLESPVNFSGPESCFVFAVFAFKIKASIILKIIE